MNRLWRFDSSFDAPRFRARLREEPPDLDVARDALIGCEHVLHMEVAKVGYRLYFARREVADAFGAVLNALGRESGPVIKHPYDGPVEERFGGVVRWCLTFETLLDVGDAWRAGYPAIYEHVGGRLSGRGSQLESA